MTEQGMTPENSNLASVELLNQPLRARVDAVQEANRRAIEVANEQRKEAIAFLRETLENRITSGDDALEEKIESLKELLEKQIEHNEKLVVQYHERQQHEEEIASAEREKAANILRESQDKERRVAEEEREKAARALREAQREETRTGYENLRQHINHNKEQADSTIRSLKDLMETTTTATENRFNTVHARLSEVRDIRSEFIPREVYEQDRGDQRRRSDAMIELIQGQSVRLTEIEARGGGEKDHAADVKSTLAVGVAIVAVVVTGVIGILSMFAV